VFGLEPPAYLLMPLSSCWLTLCFNSKQSLHCCTLSSPPADAADPLLAAQRQLLTLSSQRQQLRMQARQLAGQAEQQRQMQAARKAVLQAANGKPTAMHVGLLAHTHGCLQLAH
jgi:hypothetical protein